MWLLVPRSVCRPQDAPTSTSKRDLRVIYTLVLRLPSQIPLHLRAFMMFLVLIVLLLLLKRPLLPPLLYQQGLYQLQ